MRRWPTAEGGEPEQFPALRAHALAGAPLANAVGPLGRALRQPPVVQRDPRFREVVAHPEINPLTALRHPDTGKVHTNLKGLLSSSFPRSLPQAASALCSCFSPCRSCTSHTQGTARSYAPPPRPAELPSPHAPTCPSLCIMMGHLDGARGGTGRDEACRAEQLNALPLCAPLP